MGKKFTVDVWTLDEDSVKYCYKLFWEGDNLLVAIIELIKAKRKGYGCVTLHWR